jgi:hypothetical protein
MNKGISLQLIKIDIFMPAGAVSQQIIQEKIQEMKLLLTNGAMIPGNPEPVL